MQKWLGRFLCLACMALLLAIPAEAAQSGTIYVKLDPGDLAQTGGEVTLYFTGYPIEGGYQVTEEFGGGIVRETDALSPHLAQWLVQTPGKTGLAAALNADGEAAFKGLPDGLYLLAQTKNMDGFHPIGPRMITIPCQGDWEVKVAPDLKPIVVSEPPATGEGPLLEIWIAAMLLAALGLWICDRFRKRA